MIFKLTADGNVREVNYGGSYDDKAKAPIMAQNGKIVVLGQFNRMTWTFRSTTGNRCLASHLVKRGYVGMGEDPGRHHDDLPMSSVYGWRFDGQAMNPTILMLRPIQWPKR